MSDHHSIKETQVDLQLVRVKDPEKLQADISELCREKLFPVMEQLLDQYGAGNNVLKIDAIEIDLKDIDYEVLETIFPQRFQRYFEEELALANFKVENNLGPGTAMEEPHEWQLKSLEHFLVTGSLPWSVTRQHQLSIGSWLDQLLEDNPKSLKAMLEAGLGHPEFPKRLVYQFPDSWEKILALLAPGISAPLLAFESSWERLIAQPGSTAGKKLPGIAQKATYKWIIRHQILDMLSYDPIRFDLRQALRITHGVIREMAIQSSAAVNVLLDILIEQYQPLSEKAPGLLPVSLQALQQQLSQLPEPPKVSASSPPVVPKKPEKTAKHDSIDQDHADLTKEGSPNKEGPPNLDETQGKPPSLSIQSSKDDLQERLDAIQDSIQDPPDDEPRTSPEKEETSLPKKITPSEKEVQQMLEDMAAALEPTTGPESQKAPGEETSPETTDPDSKSPIPPDKTQAHQPGSQPGPDPASTPEQTSATPEVFPGLTDNRLGNKEAHRSTAAPEYFIDNAGLILLWPFLKPFFKALGLVDNKSFVDDPAIMRGIHLTQYLVNPEEAVPEYLLILNKILCGIQPDQSIPKAFKISKREARESEKLLSAAIENWGTLGHTSIIGFRSAFLQREGILSTNGEAWTLTVEKRAYDMLIDTLPWNIQMVKLPWMEYPLYITW